MKKLKHLIISYPEIYLSVLAIMAAYSPPFYFSPILLAIACIPLLQAHFAKRITGLILASIFALGSLYFIAALLSELLEFTEFNSSAAKLLIVGSLISVANLVAAALLFIKYDKLGVNGGEIAVQHRST